MGIQIHYWTRDVDAIIHYYTEKLAFVLAYKQPAEGPANFCILKMGDSRLMFALGPVKKIDPGRADNVLLRTINRRIGHPGPVSVYIHVDHVEEYFHRISERGAEVLESLWNTPWGLQQFSARDPDGNVTTFHQDS